MKKVFLIACLISAVTIRFSFAQQYWHSVNGGLGSVGSGDAALTLLNDTINNLLYAGGTFISADDSISCDGIAYWNGNNWDTNIPYSGGGSSYVGALILFNGQIYGGSSGIFHSDGLSWTLDASTNGSVKCLAVYNNKLYVGGEFTNVDGIQARGIACYDGSNWSEPDGGIANTQFSGAEVRAMCVWNDKLIVGGIFDQAGGTFHNSIAAWSDTLWSDLAGGVTYTSPTNVAFVNAVCVHNSDLIVGGWLDNAGGVPVNYICSYNGTNWFPLGNGLGDQDVQCLLSWDSILYVGGGFVYAGNNVIGTGGIAKWDGAWHKVAETEIQSGWVFSMAVYNSVLYIGGGFNSIQGYPAVHIARLLDYPAVDSSSEIICGGDSFNFQGQIITNEGIYYDTTYCASGEDSTIFILNLNINEINIALSVTDSSLYAPGTGTVQWYNCDSSLINILATGHYFYPATHSNYAAIISYMGCVDTTDCISFTTIEEINTTSLQVQLYPNPANETVTITSENINEIVVSNLLGEIVQSSKYKVQRPSVTIDISKLPQGIYLLRVQTNDGWQVGKMVRE